MSDKELILLFKKDSGMSDKDWQKFCQRYAGKDADISSVIETVKAMYQDANFTIPASFKKALRAEIEQCSVSSQKGI